MGRDLGCPDVALLCDLSDKLEISLEKLFGGMLTPNEAIGGNTSCYVCLVCKSITVSTGSADISCCIRKLSALLTRK